MNVLSRTNPAPGITRDTGSGRSMSFEYDFRGPLTGDPTAGLPLSRNAHRIAMKLLSAIYEKTGGRSRGVRDVTELETGLTAKAARDAWRDLLGQGLIE